MKRIMRINQQVVARVRKQKNEIKMFSRLSPHDLLFCNSFHRVVASNSLCRYAFNTSLA